MTRTDIEAIMQIVAITQGAYTIGIVTVILYYYFRRALATKRKYKIYMTIFSFSYLLLTTATAITLYRTPYHLKDVWYWLTGCAYLLCDVSILYLFKREVDRSIRNRAMGQVAEEIEMEIEKLKEHRDTVQALQNGDKNKQL